MSLKTLLPNLRISLSRTASYLIIIDIHLGLLLGLKHSLGYRHIFSADSVPLICFFRGLDLAHEIICCKCPGKKVSPILSLIVVLWSASSLYFTLSNLWLWWAFLRQQISFECSFLSNLILGLEHGVCLIHQEVALLDTIIIIHLSLDRGARWWFEGEFPGAKS